MAEDTKNIQPQAYEEENIRTLEGMEHIRQRPGMYIGQLGNGEHAADGIYVILKEVIDNGIDEFRMHAGKQINITVTETTPFVSCRPPAFMISGLFGGSAPVPRKDR